MSVQIDGETDCASQTEQQGELREVQTEALGLPSFTDIMDSTSVAVDHEPMPLINIDNHDMQIPHSNHGTTLTCKKCFSFFHTFVDLSPAQLELLTTETELQAMSLLWHDARKLRLTASTAKRVPRKNTTDPQKFLTEHFYPTFKGNTATLHGQKCEKLAIQAMEARGYTVERKGLVVCSHEPWLGASPDGILDSKELLEIKSPLKNGTSVKDFLCRPKCDIQCLSDGQYSILPNGQNGYYHQVLQRHNWPSM